MRACASVRVCAHMWIQRHQVSLDSTNSCLCQKQGPISATKLGHWIGINLNVLHSSWTSVWRMVLERSYLFYTSPSHYLRSEMHLFSTFHGALIIPAGDVITVTPSGCNQHIIVISEKDHDE